MGTIMHYYLLSTHPPPPGGGFTCFPADVFHNRTRLSQDFSFWGHEEWHLTKWWSASWNNETKKGFKLFEHFMLYIGELLRLVKTYLGRTRLKIASFMVVLKRWPLPLKIKELLFLDMFFEMRALSSAAAHIMGTCTWDGRNRMSPRYIY